VLADDVGVAHRLQELLRPLEVVHPDHHAAKPLRHVAVRSRPGDDPVLGREALRLLVEGGERHPRIEDLEHVDLLDDLEQVLVVGHRVKTIERVGYVDEAPLAPDLRDRVLHRQPLGNLLFQEQADHLPLARRLHLLGDDHLDPAHPLGHLSGGERSRDLVVIRDRDRTEAAIAGGREQHLHGGRAIRRVVGVHVKVDVDAPPPRQPPPEGPVALRIVAAKAQATVDLLDLVDHRGPVADRVPPGSRQVSAQPRLGDQPLDLTRQRDRVPGGEQKPSLSLPGQLLVERQLGGDRDRPRGQPRPDQPGSDTRATRGHADDVGGGDQLLGRRFPRPDDAHPVSKPPRDPNLAGIPHPDRRLPLELQRKAAQRP